MVTRVARELLLASKDLEDQRGKIMAKLPKRVTNVKAKEKRARSWAKNQEAKKARIAEQKKREESNRELGSTAKQRANEARKAVKSEAEKEA